MPRPRPPPTPSASTEPKALDNIASTDMETTFALPPPAMRAAEASPPSVAKPSRENTMLFSQSTPPVSPQEKSLSGSPRHKRTASGVVKPASETNSASSTTSYALPPPPSRARKIIQMKPKSNATVASPASDASYQPTAAAAAAKSIKESAASKRKQPSATSAAGRKIARKTAHSIIERRRRSKMNEEFGVLKDMIPACAGVEMHKLAILQAGIEYVRYLEGCVKQLKEENAKGQAHISRQNSRADMHVTRMDLVDDVEDDEDEDESGDDAVEEAERPRMVQYSHSAPPSEWSLRDSRRASLASQQSSAFASPNILPLGSQVESLRSGHGSNPRKRQMLPSGPGSIAASPAQISPNAFTTSATATPTLLSPAFNSIHFSPDLIRAPTNSSLQSGSSHATSANASVHIASGSGSVGATWQAVNSNPSPGMQPLPSPKAAIHLPLPPPLNANLHLPAPSFGGLREANNKSPSGLSDGGAEATATAALMMLTNDWRNGGGMKDKEGGTKAKGMSVRDLLSS